MLKGNYLWRVLLVIGVLGGAMMKAESATTLIRQEDGARVMQIKGAEDAEIRVELEDGEPATDSESASRNYAGTGEAHVGSKHGDSNSQLLLRFDVSVLESVTDQIQGANLQLNYRWATNNLPTMQLHEVPHTARDWKANEVTWNNFYGGLEGDALSKDTRLNEVKAAGAGGKKRQATFEIPKSLIRQWAQGDNPGLLLKIKGDGLGKVGALTTDSSHEPVLKVRGDWTLGDDFYKSIEGSVKLYGGIMPRKRLLEKTLGEAFKAYCPNLDLNTESSYDNFFHKACGLVMKDQGDLVLTSRLDWKHRSNKEERQNLRYVPAAKQRAERMGKHVGGIEYGLLLRKNKPSLQARAYASFVGSAQARKALKQTNPYGYVPRDFDLQSFTPPENWRQEPWKGPRPRMIHGVDVHPMEYGTTLIAEMKHLRMLGFNSILFRGGEPVVEWADKHGMMLSGLPRAENRKKSAQMAAKHPSCWGIFLKNEDTVYHWMTKMYRELGDKDEGELSEREKAFQHVKNGGFAEWAEKKHGTLEKLNKRWNTSYESWDEISLPDPRLEEITDIYEGIIGPDQVGYQFRQRFGARGTRYTIAKYPDLLDLRRYSRKVWAKWYDEQVAELRPHLGEDFIYATKAKPEPYSHRASDTFTGAGHDHGPCKYAPVDQQILIDTVQTAKGWPAWNAEDHLYNHGHSTPRRVRNAIFTKYLMGQFKDTGYCWWTMTRPSAQERFDIAVRTRNQIRRHESIFRAFLKARANADLAVLATEGNRAWDEYEPRPEESYLGGTVKAFGHMAALGRQWKYVLDRDVSAETVGKVLVIDAPWLTDKTVEKLNALPSDRKLVAVEELPKTNEYGETFPEDEWKSLKERTTVVKNWDAVSKVISPAEGLMRPYTKVGKAKFWTWNRFRGRAPWSYYMPVARLEVRRVKHEGKLYAAVINHADRAITAPIPWVEGHEVRNLMSKNPRKPVDNVQSYDFDKQEIALFEIR